MRCRFCRKSISARLLGIDGDAKGPGARGAIAKWAARRWFDRNPETQIVIHRFTQRKHDIIGAYGVLELENTTTHSPVVIDQPELESLLHCQRRQLVHPYDRLLAVRGEDQITIGGLVEVRDQSNGAGVLCGGQFVIECFRRREVQKSTILPVAEGMLRHLIRRLLHRPPPTIERA